MSDLISRQAVLDELEKWDWQDLYLPIHFKQILDDVPSVENKGEWIPVSEGLPEDGTWNLFTDGKSISVERYKMDVIDHFFPNGRWFEFKDVIAWQPLPEPYKAEKTETCKGCLEPCIMYEADMRDCKKKVREVIE